MLESEAKSVLEAELGTNWLWTVQSYNISAKCFAITSEFSPGSRTDTSSLEANKSISIY